MKPHVITWCRVALIALLATALPAAVIYVKADATGADNGTSWSDARHSLVAALAAAQSGDQIWIAAGTYRPDPGRSSSFVLKPGVVVYGGFVGSETALGQRSGNATLTVLSGDIGTVGVATDNAFHVVRCPIDGTYGLYDLTVTDGYADGAVGTVDAAGGGILLTTATGTSANATVVIENCRVSGNRAGTSSAIHSLSTGTVTLRRCLISGNQQVVGHAATGNIALFATGGLTMERCLVTGNGADASSTLACFDTRDAATFSTSIINCVFVDNQAQGVVDSSHVLRSCTFAGNRGSNLSANGIGTVENCIVMEPYSIVGLARSVFNWVGNTTDRDPLFLDPGHAFGADGIWGNADDGYQLRAGSPCIDCFHDPYNINVDSEDLRGLPRPQNRERDPGAYEYDFSGQAPIATNSTVTGREDTDLAIVITGSDADSATFAGRILSLPTRGSLLPTLDGITPSAAALTAGNLPFTLPDSQRRVLYRPPPNANGTTLTSFTADLDDGLHTSYPATVTINVTAVNDAPTITAISDVIFNEDTSLTINLTGISPGTPALAAGDPGREVQGLTVTATSSNLALLPDPTVSYTSPGGTATLTLAPRPDAFGTAIITVTVSDDGGTADGGSATTTISFTATVFGVNDPPRFFVPVGALMTEDQPADLACFLFGAGPINEADQIPNLTMIATAVDPTLLTVVGIDWTRTANSNFTVHLRPVANASGHTQLAVTLIDDAQYAGGSLASTQICDIWIQPVNDPPVLARNAVHSVTRGGRVTLRTTNLLITDADNPAPATLTFTLTALPAHGAIEFDNTALTLGSSFTLQDLIDERVSYHHDGSVPLGDLFTMDFTDGIITQPYPSVSVPVMVDGRAVPLIDVPTPGPTWQERGPTVAIAPLATVTDADTPVLSAGRVTVTLTNGHADDHLSIANLGTGSGQISLVDTVVSFGGRSIGTWHGGNGVQPLVITLAGGDASLAAVQALVRAVHFANSGTAPGATARTIQVVVDDGDSGASPPAVISMTMALFDDPPVPLPTVVATVGGVAREVVLTAVDPDSPVLTWSLVSAPTIAAFTVVDAHAGRFLLTPTAGLSGRDSCVVNVSDGVNPAVPVTITIYVGSTDFTRLQPRADPPHDAFAGEVLRFDVPFTTADLDPTTSLDFALSAGAPAGAVLSKLGTNTCRVEWLVPTTEPVGTYRRFHVIAADPTGIRVGHLPVPVLIRTAPSGGN